jgi:cytochrome c oxidase assembly protein subunit 15
MLVLTTIQLVFGALMAGHKAATAAPTWPSINGSFIPDDLFRDVPAMINFIENKITIHFVHRNLAYILFILGMVLTVQLFRIASAGRIFNRLKATPLILLTVQLLLGIVSILASPRIRPNEWGTFEWAAQLHQVTGMLFTLSLIGLLYVVRRRR